MSPKDEQRIIDVVCAALSGRSLMSKHLVTELAAKNIVVTKKELNQLLHRRKDSIAGLTYSDEGFVWSFASAKSAQHAAKTTFSAKSNEQATKLKVAAEPTTRGTKTPVAAKTNATTPPTSVVSKPSPAPAPVRTLDFVPDSDQLAVIAKPGNAHVFVEAGPGTGKTAVACRRIARLIAEEDLNPANILVISFTRTAVAEIRARIAHYVTRGTASQVQISTIDSSAWQFDTIYGDGSNDHGGKGFDGTVESALALMRKKDASLRDLLETLEHVVVDEAQDVTGIRNDFVVELVRSLPKRCGVTIFADPMQSIYGFTLTASADGSVGEAPIETEQPVDRLKAALPTFEQMELTRTHRFSDYLNVALAKARAVVANDGIDGVAKQQQLGDGIAEAAEQLPDDYKQIAELVRDDPNTLLLFRSRREVVQASSFLLSSGVPHRLRMPQLPECIQPWLARVFCDYIATTIDKATFVALFQQRCEPRAKHEPDVDTAWDLLRRLAPDQKNNVKIARLRDVLARPRPPLDACCLDSGPIGPTLGTIHASKGREAESVYLFVPTPITEGDVEEESRVLYVAATRARTRLSARTAFKAYGGRVDEKGRCYKRQSVRAQMEVGLSGDVHAVMSISDRIHATVADVAASQETLWAKRSDLALLQAERAEHGREYRLSLASDDGQQGSLVLGTLSRRVFDDATTIAKGVSKNALVDWRLQFLYLVGARTHVISADQSSELEHAHEPYRTTGFFLVPHVRGYCRFNINNVRR